MISKFVKDISVFIASLRERKGGYIFTAIIINKILGFLLSIFVINYISSFEYGLVAYAYNIISFITPFTGLGIFQSLNRFGPIQDSQNKKRQLFKFVFRNGIYASAFLVALIIISGKLLTYSMPESWEYLVIISLLIISFFIFEIVKTYFRIYGINKLFAYLEMSHSIILIILGIIFTYLWGGKGYIIALVISPLIISIYVIIKRNILVQIEKIKYSKDYKKSLWLYGLYTSMGGLTSQLIFSIDILTIGFLIKEPTQVALYKAASIIPFALLFIPVGVMKTDLIKITQEYKNKAFLKDYASNYMKLFLIISIPLYLCLHGLSNFLMSFFGEEYVAAAPLIPVFAFGLVGAFIFRNPFGNIITAVGWAKVNTYISVVALLLDIILNIWLVEKYGIIGAAYSTSILLWLAGLASYFAFRKYLNTLN